MTMYLKVLGSTLAVLVFLVCWTTFLGEAVIEQGISVEQKTYRAPGPEAQMREAQMRECLDLSKRYARSATEIYGNGLWEKCPAYFDKAAN